MVVFGDALCFVSAHRVLRGTRSGFPKLLEEPIVVVGLIRRIQNPSAGSFNPGSAFHGRRKQERSMPEHRPYHHSLSVTIRDSLTREWRGSSSAAARTRHARTTGS